MATLNIEGGKPRFDLTFRAWRSDAHDGWVVEFPYVDDPAETVPVTYDDLNYDVELAGPFETENDAILFALDLLGWHRYYYVSRPPGVGCQPKYNVVDKQTWMPRQPRPDGKGDAFGFVDYAVRLSFEQIWRYDLAPANPADAAAYAFWNYADRNGRLYGSIVREYLDAGREFLTANVDRDPMCKHALTLLDDQPADVDEPR